MDIAIYTLGCKANQYETQAMETELVRRGHHLVDFDGPADAYIVNTCAVTAASGHKSRQAIRRCKKHNPAAWPFWTIWRPWPPPGRNCP